jgi:hypothetical protein
MQLSQEVVLEDKNEINMPHLVDEKPSTYELHQLSKIA